MTEKVSHPQVYLILLKVLQTKFGQPGQIGVFGNRGFKILLKIIQQQQVEILVRQQEQVSVALRVPVQDRESGQQEVVRKRV